MTTGAHEPPARDEQFAAPPLRPDPTLIANAEGDERARKRTVAAAIKALQAADRGRQPSS